MRAKQFTEAALGTIPKRPSREGARPERGHETKPRYVTDRKTGKQYNPDEEFDKLKNSDEFQAQMKRMSVKEGPDELDQYDTSALQGYYSDFHKDLHGFRPRHHSEEEFNNPEKLKELIRGLHKYMDALKKTPEGRAQLKADGWQIDEPVDEIAGAFPSPSTRAKWAADAAASNAAEAKRQELLKAQQLQKNTAEVDRLQKINHHSLDATIPANESIEQAMTRLEQELEEHGKASRELCNSSKPDADLGASMLASCKSQGLRARDGNKSHKLGKSPDSRVKVGGHRIKGRKYGGPLPDWS